MFCFLRDRKMDALVFTTVGKRDRKRSSIRNTRKDREGRGFNREGGDFNREERKLSSRRKETGNSSWGPKARRSACLAR